MNNSKRTAGHSKQSGIAHTLVQFVASLNAALVVTRWEEYYYALNDYQLTQIGLTREEVPAELLRLLNQNQD